MAKRKSGVWINNKPIHTSKQASDALFKGIASTRAKDLTGVKTSVLVAAPTAKGVGLVTGKAALKGVDLDTYIKGLKRLVAILQNKGKALDKIMHTAYANTVTKTIKDRWKDKGGNQFRDPTGRRARGDDTRGRPVGEFTDKARLIGELLTNEKHIIRWGKGRVGIVSLTKLRSIAEISPTTSPFKSVFLMVELGTGRYAKPGPRPFSGYGSTPYKVPPGFLNTRPGDWFSRPGIAKHARAFLEAVGSEARAWQRKGTPTKKSPAGATIDDEGRPVKNWPLFAGGISSITKAPMSVETFISRARKGRHVLLNERGVVREYRHALRAAQTMILALIDEDIRNVAGKTWPGLKLTGLKSAVIGKVAAGAK